MVCKCNVMWETSNTFWAMDFRGWFEGWGTICLLRNIWKKLLGQTQVLEYVRKCPHISTITLYPCNKHLYKKIPSSPCLITKEMGVSK